MGTTKIKAYSNEIIEMSDLFRAIGHPARLQIIQLLLNETFCVGSKIVGSLSLSQSTISKHLSELKKVNLIETKIIKNSISYSINKSVWFKVDDYINVKEETFEAIEAKDKLPFKSTNRKNSNLKINNYEFKHLVLKSKSP